MNNVQKNATLKIIMTQTDYDKNTAEEKLKKWDNDFIKVIKEFLNPNFEEKERKDKEAKNKVVSVNQSIMNELRNFKDKQNKNYDSHKKFKDYIKKSYEVHQLNEDLKKQELLKQKMLKQQNKKLDSIPENEILSDNTILKPNNVENIFI
jgi:hypothetical protein